MGMTVESFHLLESTPAWHTSLNKLRRSCMPSSGRFRKALIVIPEAVLYLAVLRANTSFLMVTRESLGMPKVVWLWK